MGRRDGSAPLTSRLRGLAGAPMTLILLIRNARFETPILPPETGHVQGTDREICIAYSIAYELLTARQP